MATRVTIKSIARDLGISHMTVSRALSDNPNVQQNTREMVQKRAAELGYVRSAAARAMRGESTRLVGLLLPNITNEFYARFANTMAKACETSSYHLIIHLTNDDIALENRSIQRLREVQAMAVVMVPSPSLSAGEVDTSKFAGMKVIQLIRQQPMDIDCASVVVEDSQALSDAVTYLAKQGCQHIAYIGADAGLSSGRSRLKAFLDGLEKAGLKENKSLIHTGKPSFDMGTDLARRIFASGEADAIVCGGVEISNGVLNAFMSGAPELQKQIALIGYGDPSFYAWVNGGISTIQVPVDRLAHKAVELLEGDGFPPEAKQTIGFAAELVIR